MQIKNKFNEVVFEYDGTLQETFEAFATKDNTCNDYPKDLDLSGLNLSGFNLSELVLIGANIKGTNFNNCNLNNLVLRDCELDENTNFIGAKIRDEILKQNPVYICSGSPWDCLILDEKIILGCQCHHLRTWENITDEILTKIEKDCVPTFREWQDRVFTAAREHQKEYLDSINYTPLNTAS